MKHSIASYCRGLWWLAWLCLPAFAAYAAPIDAESGSWSLTSPDGRCGINVFLDATGNLDYEATQDGQTVIRRSALGLRRDDQDFAGRLVLDRAGKIERRREQYELFAGTQTHVNHRLNFRSLALHNANHAALVVDLAASDEGVAFRYRFPDDSPDVRAIRSELSSFAVPAKARGWLQPYHAASDYTPAYEDFYFPVSAGDPPPDSRQKAVGWAFPALFQIPDTTNWVLLTEAGTDASYCGCHLQPDCAGGLYKIAFPLANESTRGYTNQFGPEPRASLPWTLPWRVIVMGRTAGDIATASLVTDLASPSRIADASWVHPGRASWGWWSHPDGPTTAAMFNEFSDFAAKMGWEYTLFDAGWWQPGIEPIARHAVAEGVTPLAWMFATDFYDRAKTAQHLDAMAAVGVRGVKVDFWCSDRQEAIAAQQALMQAAAERKMIVNLHGCTIPRGWQRTWPNFLTCEAVLGDESYFFESRYTEKAAELDTVLPFTRNAVGPMDLTPVACSPKKYVRTTTAAHELATALVFTSGIIHYADQPSFFESLPQAAQQVLRDAPARWDETRCLIGDPGRVVVFARRTGPSWFIAGLSGTTNAQPITLDLSPYKKFRHRTAIIEGTDAQMQVAAAPIDRAATWQHTIPSRGGFILRLEK
jgi:hypothetical protein